MRRRNFTGRNWVMSPKRCYATTWEEKVFIRQKFLIFFDWFCLSFGKYSLIVFLFEFFSRCPKNTSNKAKLTPCNIIIIEWFFARPTGMKKDTIQKRNRKEQGTSSSAKARRKQRELMEQEEREELERKNQQSLSTGVPVVLASSQSTLNPPQATINHATSSSSPLLNSSPPPASPPSQLPTDIYSLPPQVPGSILLLPPIPKLWQAIAPCSRPREIF